MEAEKKSNNNESEKVKLEKCFSLRNDSFVRSCIEASSEILSGIQVKTFNELTKSGKLFVSVFYLYI